MVNKKSKQPVKKQEFDDYFGQMSIDAPMNLLIKEFTKGLIELLENLNFKSIEHIEVSYQTKYDLQHNEELLLVIIQELDYFNNDLKWYPITTKTPYIYKPYNLEILSQEYIKILEKIETNLKIAKIPNSLRICQEIKNNYLKKLEILKKLKLF